MLRCHRLLVGLLAGLAFLGVLAQGAAASDPVDMDWTVLDRFGGDVGGSGSLEDADPLTPPAIDEFAVRVLPSAATCARLGKAKWRVDGDLVRPVLEAGEACAAVVRLEGEGGHRVKVFVGTDEERAPVVVDDKLIVALGDSVAAGEGNPDASGGWLDPPCHRSAAAGFEVAAHRLAEVDQHRSITFVSLACSGAEVHEGLLGSYRGIAPRRGGTAYPAQVERLEQLAEARGGGEDGPAVDAVLVSVGANDLHFSGVARRCALSPGDCSGQEEEGLNQSLRGLGDSYDELGRALKAAAPAAPVFITEYFDPTHDADGRFCRHSVVLTSRAESQWAYEKLLRRLNAKVETAADRNKWRFVDGIAADFERHGICAGDERWVRRLEESVLFQGDPFGTLHPNEEGQRRIGRRVVTPLADQLGFVPPPEPEVKKEDGWSTLDWIVTAATAISPPAVAAGTLIPSEWKFTWWDLLAAWLLLPIVAILLVAAWRALLILRLTWPEDPAGLEPEPPKLKGRGERQPLTVRQLLLIAAGIAVLFAVTVVVAGLVGRAIIWLRFWSSNLPADQAVSEVAPGELVSTGAAALAIFVGLGLVAAAVAWLLDGKGREVRTTRRGLVAIGLVEVVAALWIGDFRRDQALELFFGLVAAALLLHYLVEVALEKRREWEDARRWGSASFETPGQGLWTGVKAHIRATIKEREGRGIRIFQLLPFVFLLVAFYFSFHADGLERMALVFLPYLVAAMLFAAPWGMAAAGVRWKKPDYEALKGPRIALAVFGLAIIVVLLFREELWLAATAAAAAGLGLLCLAVAAASEERFGPYGLAVLISVPLFAGAAAFLHGIDSPELQPVAVVLDNGEAVCGAYIGESDDQLWLGRLVLDERAGAHRPRRGAIAPVDAERVEARSLGPLEPVDRVEARALELRDRLLDEQGDRDLEKRTDSCAAPELQAPVVNDRQHRLAVKFQPELVVDREDLFWPVPVETLFSVRDRRATICRHVARGDDGCLRLTTPGEFPWIGGEGEWLEYPAANDDYVEQHDQMVEALGTADPEASAAEYFLIHREGKGPISIQYWFFYPFNYQPAGDHFIPGGYHEGDFEAIGVLLSKRGEPRYVWMNRHDAEGRAFPWSDDALELVGEHPRVYAARGSHATYENCDRQLRPLFIKGLIDDRPTCDAVKQLHLLPKETPLINLSRVGWACWQGLFGHRKGKKAYEQLPSLINDAPRSPLWQQKFGGAKKEPCLGRSDPGDRDGVGEEVVKGETEIPAKLRKGASPLEAAIDDCADWENPATRGIYMVACAEDALDRYVESGLETPDPAEVRIEKRLFEDLGSEPSAMPAVRRDRNRSYLDDWRISAMQPTEVSVFASCPGEGGIVAAEFKGVRVGPSSSLTVRDEGGSDEWFLAKSDGSPVAEATPFRTEPDDGILERRPAKKGDDLACERPDD
jgi:lysophospholipase L1-like esterase